MCLELAEARKQLQLAGKYLVDHGLTFGNAGNLSARIGETTCMITASGARLGELSDDDFVICNMSECDDERYPRKPSKELPIHRVIYEMRPEINAVFHAAPFYGTLAACSDLTLPSNWFVESMFYLERVERVTYYHPGSVELAEAVGGKVGLANMMLMENHGVLVFDTSVREALNGLQTLEYTARMAVTARCAGIEMKGLPPETVTDFLEKSGYKARREWTE